MCAAAASSFCLAEKKQASENERKAEKEKVGENKKKENQKKKQRRRRPRFRQVELIRCHRRRRRRRRGRLKCGSPSSAVLIINENVRQANESRSEHACKDGSSKKPLSPLTSFPSPHWLASVIQSITENGSGDDYRIITTMLQQQQKTKLQHPTKRSSKRKQTMTVCEKKAFAKAFPTPLI